LPESHCFPTRRSSDLLVRERPATFSRNPGIPTISERMIPESLKLSVWSKSLASKYSFAIILVVSSLGSHTTTPPRYYTGAWGRSQRRCGLPVLLHHPT